VDQKGRPLRLLITPGQAHDAQGAAVLLSDLARKSVIIADKAYDADWIRAHIRAQGAKANIPNKASRTRRHYRWQKQLYRERNVTVNRGWAVRLHEAVGVTLPASISPSRSAACQ
jgi:transposase